MQQNPGGAGRSNLGRSLGAQAYSIVLSATPAVFCSPMKMAANDDGLEGTDTTDSKDNLAFLPKDEGSIDCSQTKHENLFFYPFGIQRRISDF